MRKMLSIFLAFCLLLSVGNPVLGLAAESEVLVESNELQESDLAEVPEVLEEENVLNESEELISETLALGEIIDQTPAEEPLEEITEITSAGNLEKIADDSQVEVAANVLDVYNTPTVQDDSVAALGTVSMALNSGRLSSYDEAIFSLPDGFQFVTLEWLWENADRDGYYIMDDSIWNNMYIDNYAVCLGDYPYGNYIKIPATYDYKENALYTSATMIWNPTTGLFEDSDTPFSPFYIKQISDQEIQLIVNEVFDSYTNLSGSYFELHLNSIYIENGYEGNINLEITENGGGFMSTSGRTVAVVKSGTVDTKSTNKPVITEDGTNDTNLVEFRITESMGGLIDSKYKALTYKLPSGLQWQGNAIAKIVSGDIDGNTTGDVLTDDYPTFITYSNNMREMYLNFDNFFGRSSLALKIDVKDGIVVDNPSRLTEGDLVIEISSEGRTNLSNTSFIGLAYTKGEIPARKGRVHSLDTVSMKLNSGRLSGGDEAILSLPSGFQLVTLEVTGIKSNIDGYYLMDDSVWNELIIDSEAVYVGDYPSGNYIRIPAYYDGGNENALYTFAVQEWNPSTGLFDNRDTPVSPFYISQISNYEIKVFVEVDFDGYNDLSGSYFELHLGQVFAEDSFKGEVTLEISEMGGGFKSDDGSIIGSINELGVSSKTLNISETNGTWSGIPLEFRISENIAGDIDIKEQTLVYKLPSGLQWNGGAEAIIVSGSIGSYKAGDLLSEITNFITYSDNKQEMYLNFNSFTAKSGSILRIDVKESLVITDLSQLNQGEVMVEIAANGDTKLNNSTMAGLIYNPGILEVFSTPTVVANKIAALGTMSMELQSGRLWSGDKAVFSLPSGFQFVSLENSGTGSNVDGYYLMNDTVWNKLTVDSNAAYIGDYPNGNYLKIPAYYDNGNINDLYTFAVQEWDPNTGMLDYRSNVVSPFAISQTSGNEVQLVVADEFGDLFYQYSSSYYGSYFELHLGNVYIKDGFIGDINLVITETGNGFVPTSGETIGIAKEPTVSTKSTNAPIITEDGTHYNNLVEFRITENVAGAIDLKSKALGYKLPEGLQWRGDAVAKIVSGSIDGYGAGDLFDTMDLIVYSNDMREMYLNFNLFKEKSSSALKLDVYDGVVVDDSSKVTIGDINIDISSNGNTVLNEKSFVGLSYGVYGLDPKVTKTTTIIAGQLDQDLGEFELNEMVPNSLYNNRTLNLSLPSGCYWTALPSRIVSKGNSFDFGGFSDDGSTAKYRVTTSGSDDIRKIASFSFADMQVVTPPNFTGDLTVTFGGNQNLTGEITLATVIAPLTLKVDRVANLVIDQSAQKIGDITITENVKEAFIENKELVLQLPSGLSFSSLPTVTVTAGDLELKNFGSNLVYDGRSLVIAIAGQSSQASTITVSDIAVTVNQNVAEGKANLQIKGSGVLQCNDADAVYSYLEDSCGGFISGDGYYYYDDFKGLKLSDGAIYNSLSTAGEVVVANCRLNLDGVVTGVALDKTALTLGIGKQGTLQATITPANAEDQTVAWSTSDPAIATVNSEGVVTAVAVGEATIMVTTNDGGFTANCQVTVSDSVKLAGDINGDTKVNNRDATRLLQHLAGWKVEVVEECLDVNGDGKVNNRDATRLLQYLAGWPVEVF